MSKSKGGRYRIEETGKRVLVEPATRMPGAPAPKPTKTEKTASKTGRETLDPVSSAANEPPKETRK